MLLQIVKYAVLPEFLRKGIGRFFLKITTLHFQGIRKNLLILFLYVGGQLLFVLMEEFVQQEVMLPAFLTGSFFPRDDTLYFGNVFFQIVTMGFCEIIHDQTEGETLELFPGKIVMVQK